MQSTDVVVIGAGQAGLAISYHLTQRNIDHLVLDRGRIAERWRSERWDSLTLLTPNWQARLPGHSYRGPQPNSFMSMPEVVAFLEQYATLHAAPVQSHTRLLRVDARDAGYWVRTDRGEFSAANVVLATGYCDRPAQPDAAHALHDELHQLTPSAYRNPSALAPGGVLVVGASASGVQIADELARHGRQVTLAVGRHTRLPRQYRGADIMCWLERIGALDETVDDVRDLGASRDQPSLQLVGSDPPRDLDLSTLMQRGVRVYGRFAAAAGTRVWFADDLARSVSAADAKLRRLLNRIDRFIETDPGQWRHEPIHTPEPLSRVTRSGGSIDLAAEAITTVIWATGFRRDYAWLGVPVLDARGELVHTRGITPAEGLYALGLPFQYKRKSNFIDGVAEDAEYIARQIAARLGVRESVAA